MKRMKRIISCVLALVFLASCLPLAVMPVAAQGIVVPGDKDGDKIVSEEELASVILPYMLGEPGHRGLDEVREIAHIHVYYPRTITDSADRTVTIYKPIERIAVLDSYGAEAIRAIGAKDRIVGVADVVNKRTMLFPDLSELPCVGTYMEPDAEEIIALNPDIVFVAGAWQEKHLGDKLERVNIHSALLRFHEPEAVVESMKKLGYILDEMENVNRYFEWHDKYVDEIKSKVSEIPDDKKPKVFIEYGGTMSTREVPGKGKGLNQYCTEAGGVSITAELVGKEVEVEWILNQTLDVIVGYDRKGRGGYEIDDVSEFEAYRNEIIALPGFENITAVKENRVYIMTSAITGGPGYILTHAYFAKWFHTDPFKDLDPQAIHQEYIDKFCGIDFNVKEQGVFVYPKPS